MELLQTEDLEVEFEEYFGVVELEAGTEQEFSCSVNSEQADILWYRVAAGSQRSRVNRPENGLTILYYTFAENWRF